METTSALAALSALAHASRLAIFRHLMQLGLEGAYPGEMASALALPQATLSFHLKALAHAGLVEAEPLGRHIRYRASFARMQGLLDYLTHDCCGGDLSRCAPSAPALVAPPHSPSIQEHTS